MHVASQGLIFVALLAGCLALCVGAWRITLKRTRGTNISTWRSILESLGLAAASLSFAIYLVILGHAHLMSTGAVRQIDLIRLYGHLGPVELAAMSVPLALFGKGFPRIATVIVGVAMTFLWLWYAAASV